MPSVKQTNKGNTELFWKKNPVGLRQNGKQLEMFQDLQRKRFQPYNLNRHYSEHNED